MHIWEVFLVNISGNMGLFRTVWESSTATAGGQRWIVCVGLACLQEFGSVGVLDTLMLEH